jgi:ribonuclease R
VHERPDREKLQKFSEFLNALGYKIKLKASITSLEFQGVLKRIEGGKDEILIKEVALRTMMKAIYSIKNVGHFGLAFRDYTHFILGLLSAIILILPLLSAATRI